MVICFKVPFKNDKVSCEIHDMSSMIDTPFAIRLVRCGIAEEVKGNDAINYLREEAGLPCL